MRVRLHFLFPVRCSGRELRGDNALQHGGRAATAAVFAAGIRQLAGAVQSGGARLEGHHAARHAIRQAQRTGHATGDGHPHVGPSGHRNTRRARRTQLTTVSIIVQLYLFIYLRIIIRRTLAGA